jgi:hypothetical protein
MADDGSLSALGMMNLPQLLSTLFGGQVTADQVRPLYPGLNDSMIISEIFTGRAFQWSVVFFRIVHLKANG